MTQSIITQDDLAGLLAVAEFLELAELEGDASQVPAKLRDLAARLSALVVLPDA